MQKKSIFLRAVFLATVPVYVTSETLLTLEDDEISMRVANLIMCPVDKPIFPSDVEAEINGLVFKHINGQWRLSKVFAYLEILK